MVGSRFGEICSCCCLHALPKVLLHYVLQIIMYYHLCRYRAAKRQNGKILFALRFYLSDVMQSDPIHPGHVNSFPAALSLISLALAARGFHNAGVVPNAAVDIAPRHSGTVFGLVNTLGSVSGSSGNRSSSSRELIARMNSKLINSHSTSCGSKAT